METSDLLPVLREVFEDVFDIDASGVTEDSTPDDVKGWDSLGNIRLFVAIETRLNVSFSTSEIVGAKSVASLLDMVGHKIGRP